MSKTERRKAEAALQALLATSDVLALLSAPDESLPSPRGLHLCVNRRSVRDRGLAVGRAPDQGSLMVGPLLMGHGTDAQRAASA